ncbi:MAG: hypothetical protein EXR71_17330 [Myxococcales bacterium]|nr:hypothetical protein [Myxococcales bacterium]
MNARIALLSAVVIAALVPYDALADVRPSLADQAPCAAHWLGTDHLGRDVLRRLAAGGAAFVGPGLGAAALAAILGTLAGAAAGWRGGAVAGGARMVFGAIQSIPSLVLVLLCLMALGPGPVQLAVAGGLAGMPTMASSVDARITSLRTAEFVLAARAHGIPPHRLLWWHLVWVNSRDIVVREALAIGGSVLVLEVTLSYLGHFGVAEPAASWGNMLAHALSTGCLNRWSWLAPGAAVLATLWATSPGPGRR